MCTLYHTGVYVETIVYSTRELATSEGPQGCDAVTIHHAAAGTYCERTPSKAVAFTTARRLRIAETQRNRLSSGCVICR